ncbi:hypothetical protein EDB83DRAFT_2423891 [Lactarius deliciosus]|nr:hypothetical protein EDB83DRAFT_2423891 [Lactarius deliciosus]
MDAAALPSCNGTICRPACKLAMATCRLFIPTCILFIPTCMASCLATMASKRWRISCTCSASWPCCTTGRLGIRCICSVTASSC